MEVLRGRNSGNGFKSLMASFLFTHNLRVGLVSMGLGVLAGVPTVLLLLYNGMMCAALSPCMCRRGSSWKCGPGSCRTA